MQQGKMLQQVSDRLQNKSDEFNRLSRTFHNQRDVTEGKITSLAFKVQLITEGVPQIQTEPKFMTEDSYEAGSNLNSSREILNPKTSDRLRNLREA